MNTSTTTIEISIANEINRLHAELCDIAKVTLEKAIRIGELLLKEKARLKHGGWLKWIEANLEFDDRTVRRYTDLCRNQEYLKTDTVSDLTSGYRMLTNRRKAEQRREEQVTEYKKRVKLREEEEQKRNPYPPVVYKPDPPTKTPEEIEADYKMQVKQGLLEFIWMSSHELGIHRLKVAEYVAEWSMEWLAKAELVDARNE